MDPEKFAGMQFRMVNAFNEGRLGDVIGLMQTYFGPDKYTIWQLFQDEKRKILDQIAQQSLQELEESLRRTYNRDYSLVNALANNDIPIPNAYRTTFEYILNADLIDCLPIGQNQYQGTGADIGGTGTVEFEDRGYWKNCAPGGRKYSKRDPEDQQRT